MSSALKQSPCTGTQATFQLGAFAFSEQQVLTTSTLVLSEAEQN